MSRRILIVVGHPDPSPDRLCRGLAKAYGEGAEKAGQTIAEAGTAFVKNERSTSIIQRMATVDEVANLVVYVCSPQASATTGAALRVDGGVLDTIA